MSSKWQRVPDDDLQARHKYISGKGMAEVILVDNGWCWIVRAYVPDRVFSREYSRSIAHGCSFSLKEAMREADSWLGLIDE